MISWIIFCGSADGGVHMPIRLMQGFSVSKQNESILRGASDLELFLSLRLLWNCIRNSERMEMCHRWGNPDTPDARSALVIHSSASDKTLCVELRLHERVKDKSTGYYAMHPRKISHSWPNLWTNPQLSFREVLSYNRFNCMTNESFYGDV